MSSRECHDRRSAFATTLSNRGREHQVVGRLVEAVADYSAAERIYRALIEQEGRSDLRDEWAIVRNDRGSAYRMLGYLAGAIADHTIAEGTLRELVEHEAQTEFLDELADTLERRGNAQRALAHLDGALADHSAAEAMYQHLVCHEHRLELRPSWASTLVSRGRVHQQRGKLDEALADFDAAERLYRQLVTQDRRTELRSRLALALASRGSLLIARAQQASAADDPEAVRRAIDEACALVDAAKAEAGATIEVDWELDWKINDELGDICRLTGDLSAALKYEEAAIEVLEGVRRRQGSSLERSVFLAGKVDAYLDAAELGLALAQQTRDARERAAYIERAYGALLKLKARDLAEALDEEPLAARLARLPADARRELSGLLAEADALRNALCGRHARALRDAHDPRLAELRGIDDRIIQLQIQLAHDPEAVTAGIVAPTPDAIAAALEPGEIVVDVLDSVEQPAVFVVSRACSSDPDGPAGAEIAAYPLDKGRLDAAGARIERARVDRGGRAGDLRRMRPALGALRRALLPPPVVARIRAAHAVFLVPHAATSRLPLLHLRLPGGTPLMTRARRAAVIPSAGLLIAMRRPDDRRAGQRAPDLALVAVAADAVLERRLSYVDPEIYGVRECYAGAPVRCHPSSASGWGDRLDRAGLLAILERQQWIHALHLGSHGTVLDPSRPGSVALLLHGPADEPRTLTAQEIASRLQAIVDLVMMTACWSGQVGRGHEADGVTAAFLRGGWARSLLVCLWPVEDRAAALFGIVLHQEWRSNGGRTLGEAFVATRERLAGLRELDALALLRRMPNAPAQTPAPVLRGGLDSTVGAPRGGPGRMSGPRGGGLAVSLVDLAAFQLVGDPDLRPWLG